MIVFLFVVTFAASVRVLREYERAVIFKLGRFQSVSGPGLVLLIPMIQTMVRVDLRIQVIEVAASRPQERMEIVGFLKTL